MKNQSMNVPLTHRDVFHIVGLSTLIASVFIMSWAFYNISSQGYFIMGENNLFIRYSECGLIGFSNIYAFYLLANYVRKKF
jgi:hypothetical protein